MKEGKASEAKSGNKGLVILLCMLAVVIVGLGVGLAIVMLNGGEKETVVIEEKPMEEVEIAETDPEAAAATRVFVAGQEAIEAEATELLNQALPDVDRIRQLYAGPYADFVANGEISYAYSYLMSELNLYYENGYKEAALDLLTSIDLNIYDDELRWMFYDIIIRTADELGKSEISSDYRARAAYLEENTDIVLAPDMVHYSNREER